MSNLVWRKPSKCANTECVEVAQDGSMIAIKIGDAVGFRRATRDEFRAFIAAAKAGEYDDLTGEQP